jgi:hypothetical protein
MQTCTNCYTQSPDDTIRCIQCDADLRDCSATAMALKRFQTNPRVRLVRISVGADACPACYEVQGAYAKDAVPRLPVEGCSHNHGCRCFYEPVLDEIYP